jgi:hypothetical protein
MRRSGELIVLQCLITCYSAVIEIGVKEMGEPWLTKAGEALIREEWELMNGQERGRQGKGRQILNELTEREEDEWSGDGSAWLMR